MANKFQTTFIPKSSGQEVTSIVNGSNIGNKSGNSLERILVLITLVIFLSTIATYGYMWFKKTRLNNSIADIKQSLEVVRKSLEDGEINQIIEINNRLLASSKLYSEHLAPVEIFGILEDYTLKSATFNNFLYEYLEDGTVHIFANGSAAGYESIVLLSDEYDKSNRMKRILVTNLKRASDGTVTFSLDAFVDEEVIRYKNLDNFSINRAESLDSELLLDNDNE